MKKNKKPKIVVIGGGTGTSVVLRGLVKYDVSLSAIISTSDDGGSSGMLRQDFDMVPPGDIRQCFVAVNNKNNKFLDIFHDRFAHGKLKGHAFGNLFFALLAQNEGDFVKVMQQAEDMVGAEHHIIPVTNKKTDIYAYLNDGTVIDSQYKLKIAENLQPRLEKMEVEPKGIELSSEVEGALSDADMIVVGPGDLVSSVAPPLLVGNIVDLINKSKAKKVFVGNIFNVITVLGFSLYDYLMFLEKYVGKINFDVAVYNTGKISDDRLDALNISKDEVVKVGDRIDGIEYVGRSVADSIDAKIVEGDAIQRPPLKHDSDKIAKVLYGIIAK